MHDPEAQPATGAGDAGAPVDRRVAPIRSTRLEIESLDELAVRLDSHDGDLSRWVLKALDLRDEDWVRALAAVDLRGVTFLGCRLAAATLDQAEEAEALVFPPIDGLPFDPYRGGLYTPDELYDTLDRVPGAGYSETSDARIDAWFRENRPPDVLAALFQRLHDHAITDAVAEVVEGHRVVGIMGGHDADRADPMYATVAALARDLQRGGLLVATGGGPGLMEAANLGAFLGPSADGRLDSALDALAGSPRYADRDRWLRAAWNLRNEVPVAQRGESLGIPTWFYGHEPPNVFATWCAKYFENSVREDGLLALADAGVVFMPGGAGTVQEVFQDACGNHYADPGAARPMVFFGVEEWTEVLPAVPLLRRLAGSREYADRIVVTDDPAEAVAALAAGGSDGAGRSRAGRRGDP